jgi:hypothetical protein
MITLLIKTIQSLVSIGKIILLSKIPKKPVPNARLNSSCVILANGPSLTKGIKNLDLEKHDVLCVNNFVSSSLYSIIKPRSYIVAAPILFEKSERLSKTYIDLRNTIFDGLKEKTEWTVYIMVPFVAKKSSYFQDFLKSTSFFVPIYYNPTPVEGLTFISHFLFNAKLGMPRPHNVLVPSLMKCIALGYKKIFLFGADHSWLKEISVNEQNEALVNQKHFYDENESKPEKMEDFITRPRKLHEIIHKFYLSFRSYWEIKEFAEKRGVSIINCTEGSMIDAFDRGTINSITKRN